MEDLIEALNILMKYDNPKYPTHCEPDVLHVAIDPEKVSEDDKKRLEELGFIDGSDSDEHEGGFYSYRFGSC